MPRCYRGATGPSVPEWAPASNVPNHHGNTHKAIATGRVATAKPIESHQDHVSGSISNRDCKKSSKLPADAITAAPTNGLHTTHQAARPRAPQLRQGTGGKNRLRKGRGRCVNDPIGGMCRNFVARSPQRVQRMAGWENEGGPGAARREPAIRRGTSTPKDRSAEEGEPTPEPRRTGPRESRVPAGSGADPTRGGGHRRLLRIGQKTPRRPESERDRPPSTKANAAMWRVVK